MCDKEEVWVRILVHKGTPEWIKSAKTKSALVSGAKERDFGNGTITQLETTTDIILYEELLLQMETENEKGGE